MADLNIRNVDPELIARLKAEAALGGVTLRDRCLVLLSGLSPVYPHQTYAPLPSEAAAKLAAAIPGVRLGMNGPQLSVAESVEEAEPERRMCQYKEYVGDIGEWMRCGLFEHGPKTKHGNWQQV